MTKGEKSVNTVEAKNRFNELVADVTRTRRPVIVKKRNEPVAVVVDYESYQKESIPVKKKGGDPLLQELRAFHRSMEQKYPQGTGDSVEILREIRQERIAR